ncbi:hypothetical protein ACIOHS_26755 [Streptomyces sp. NPDC088253]
MKHNPRRCPLCGTFRNGFVGMRVRKTLVGQTRSNGENSGEGK